MAEVGTKTAARYGSEDMLTCDERLRNQAAVWKTPHGNGNPNAGAGGGEFAKQANQWPTVRATSGGGNRSAYNGAPYRPAIAQVAQTWPTLNAADEKTSQKYPHKGGNPTLVGATGNWTTPQSHDSTGGTPERVRRCGTKHGCANLADDVSAWPGNWATPTAHDGRRSGSDEASAQGRNLKREAESFEQDRGDTQWQTPATDSFRSRGGDRRNEMGLDQQARAFPTPACRDYRSPNLKPYAERGGQMKGEQLQNFIEHSFRLDLETRLDGESASYNPAFKRPLQPVVSTGSFLQLDALVYHWMAWRAHHNRWDAPYVRPALRQRLNPNFVDSLMSWPSSWTSAQTVCGPEAMELWRSAVRSHLESF
jgi:hypothetical protein